MGFRVENGRLLTYTGQESRVTLPEEVTEIGKEAFANCGSLASVTFCGGLQTIGEAAFFRCTHLRWALLPDTVIELAARAFYGCEHMMSVKLSKGLKVIGDEAFARCRSLESVTIPESVEAVGEGVFAGCSRLREVRVSEKWRDEHPDLYEKLMNRIENTD